jgi:hypothetical protein
MLAVIGLTSCQKAELKKPVNVNFSFKMVQEKSGEGLQMQSGAINLKSFDVIGDRVEGDGIYFERLFEEGLNSDLNGSNEIKDLGFDLPQGDYQDLEIEFESFAKNSDPSIYLEGKYRDDSGIVDVNFEITEELMFSVRGYNESADQMILLDKDNPRKVNIEFEIDDWFSLVDEAIWANAEVTQQNGPDLLLISETNNIAIYTLVIDRMTEDNKAIFKN